MNGLKSLIRERLLGSPKLQELLRERPELREEPTQLLRYLEEHGLVDELFATLETTLQEREPWPAGSVHAAKEVAQAGGELGYSSPPVIETAATTGAAAWQLQLRLVEGRAFLDYLDGGSAENRMLQWHVSFGGHRFRTRAVSSAVDPIFDALVCLPLPEVRSRAALLTHASPVHLVLTCQNASCRGDDAWDTGSTVIVCSHLLEWRHCLAVAGPHKIVEELHGVGRRSQLACGVLHATVELTPVGGVSSLLAEKDVGAQLRGEQHRRDEVMRRVFEDLDQWWSQYYEMFLSRYVCLFAQTERCRSLPVTSFVTPLEAGRALDTPGHALRWVGLFGTEARPALESTEPRWQTFPALWARGVGTIEEKALLLCSLLIGFSLDAWCCLGTDARGQPHAWVISRSNGDSSYPADVVCWDVRTSVRISVDNATYLTTYSSVDLVFNNYRLLICCADTAARTTFDFSDPRCWLPVPIHGKDLDALRLYPSTRCTPFADLRPRLWSLPCEPECIEEAIEKRLAAAVRAHREAAGLQTLFDEHLGQLLQVALANCELERLGASCTQAPGFEEIIRQVCAEGEVFRAVPVQFNHLRISLYWPTLSDRPPVRELLALSAGPPRFAVRARVVVYPEGCVAAWATLGVRARA
eukprot:TRINITY_DN28783_c0_g1_i1.p1 TRINITY_DN28783_c0_g1~~TRINITY_DN28783_c0_g1_i1.p1  ORF type:complete len:641 (-),score=92.73 TRINITY_DN28783_c0_g1_i1:66-1988(-)